MTCETSVPGLEEARAPQNIASPHRQARASDLVKAEDAWRQISVGSLVEYSREGLPSLRAEVIAKEEGTCDLWWPGPSGPECPRFQVKRNADASYVIESYAHLLRTPALSVFV
ncbi:unnamed protein product [Cladocopium goreaui]|uniref:Uncharacterized protein n=1 Tax=Cladocopium goreaui TaxID=2562237 RepID=A0A9P1BIG3_9DINO|nr:unnamed protein product [Cladocopium goreaui]